MILLLASIAAIAIFPQFTRRRYNTKQYNPIQYQLIRERVYVESEGLSKGYTEVVQRL